MSGDSVAEDQIRAFVDRILRLKEEASGINTDIREVYAEAAAAGIDKTFLGLHVRRAWQEGSGCTVYFAAFRSAGLLKIGISRNVPARLARLSSLRGEQAELINSFVGMFAIEGWFHAQFGQWRRDGEWFDLCPESERLARLAINPLFNDGRQSFEDNDPSRHIVSIDEDGYPLKEHEPAPRGPTDVAADGDGPVVAPPSAEPVASKSTAARKDVQHAQGSKPRVHADLLAGSAIGPAGTQAPPVDIPADAEGSGATGGTDVGVGGEATLADHSKPNPWCRDPDDCGVYASWHFTCLACLRAKAAALAQRGEAA